MRTVISFLHSSGALSTTYSFLFVGIGLVLGSCSRTEPVPRLQDSADLISEAGEARVRDFQESLLLGHDIELAVEVPASSPPDLERYAHDRMERMAVGSATGGRRGLLLVIDADSARVRFEVGHDLEDIFPDAFVSRVEHDQMAPFFAEGRVGDGVEATVELFVAQANQMRDGRDRVGGDIGRPGDYSAGAGATARAPVGKAGDGRSTPEAGASYGPGPSPRAVMEAYLLMLTVRESAPDHEIYTEETRRLLSARVVTPAQQDNEYRELSRELSDARFVESDSHAVALFGSDEVPPYFFERGAAGWMLDLATPSRSIRFDHDNRWFFVELPSRYAFAFE